MKYLSEVPGVSTSVHDWKPVTPKDFLDALHRYATVCSADHSGDHGNEGMAGLSPWAFKLDRKTTATVWYMPKRGKAPDVVSSPCLLTIAREDGSVICFESLNHGLDRHGKPWHATDRIVTHVAPGQAAAPLETGEVDAPHRTVSPGALALDTAKTIFGDAEPPAHTSYPIGSWPSTADGGMPRRIRQDLWHPAEKAISDAMAAVEACGASLSLTRAVQRLSEAKDALADHLEGLPTPEASTVQPRTLSAGDCSRLAYLAKRGMAELRTDSKVRAQDVERIAALEAMVPVTLYGAGVFDDLEATRRMLAAMDMPSAKALDGAYARGTGGVHVESVAGAFRFYVERMAEYGYRTRAQQAELDALKGMLERKGEPDDAGELTARYSADET